MANSGSSFSTPAKPPHERGKSSYQDPNGGALGIDQDLEGLVGDRLLGAIAGGCRQALLDRQGLDAQQGRALRELAREVALTGRDLALQLVLPGGHAVDPRDDAELPAAERVGLERAVPAIEVLGEPLHRQLAPASLPGRAEAQGSAEHLVPVAQERRPHVDALAEGALGRVATGVDLGPDALDADARRSLRGERQRGLPPDPRVGWISDRLATTSAEYAARRDGGFGKRPGGENGRVRDGAGGRKRG